MTLRELDRYRDMRKQLIDGEELLERLRGRAVPGSPATDGMPHASGTSDKVGSLAIAIVDLEARLPVLKARIEAQGKDVVEWIDTIEDHKIRLSFRLRYQLAYTWKEVADALGDWETEEGVKQRCYRYLNLSEEGLYDEID